MGKTFKRLAIGTTLAAAAGYVTGILTAPKSGKETRGDLKKMKDEKVSDAEKELKKLHTELTDLIGEAKDRANGLKGKAKAELDDAAAKASVAKQKAREILSAVHEGDAENKDLKLAVGEANKAIKHLKAYLKK